MDRRSWPWRKKRSEKTAASNAAPDGSAGNQADQVNSKSVEQVKISEERYASLMESEDQVLKLTEKLSAAQTDLSNKESLVNQHAKVAEEAVSGWEKAEAEASALKIQLESVTLLKLTVEERAAHLDGALKECMKQLRLAKEEGEQKLRDVVLDKTEQWEKAKLALDSKIGALESENAALSRSLQERSYALGKLGEEKSQAEEEIQVLKAGLLSSDKEIGSLRYEAQVLSKELEIRNEEKNMCQRSAEIAVKQHVEDTKKITKLEAECQRLRGLVRKKLPGAAAIAQMRQEVDDARSRPVSSHGTPRSRPHDFALENFRQCYRENELLATRMLAMEEETKLLKEALATRSNELQASRTLSAKTAARLRQVDLERSLIRNGSDPPSLTSVSDEAVEEELSQSGSWAAALTPELPHKKAKDKEETCSSPLDLMDDFLEMERLACLSADRDKPTEDHQVLFSSIKSGLASLIKAQEENLDLEKLIADIKTILHSTQQQLSPGSVCENGEESHPREQLSPGPVHQDGEESRRRDLETAVSRLLSFVPSLQDKSPKDAGDSFSVCNFAGVLSDGASLESFVISLSAALGDGKTEGEVNGSTGPDPHPDEMTSASEVDQLKSERDSLRADLEQAEVKLKELEIELTAAQKSNSLAETQLKCMAESYRSLEAEIRLVRERNEILDEELQREKLSRQDLQQQLEMAAPPLTPETKTNQEREIAAAAERLAECQETITLLGRHLRALRSDDGGGGADVDGMAAFLRRAGGESPAGGMEPLVSPSRSEAGAMSPARSKRSNHRASTSFSSNPLTERQGRAFSRFFSKGKNSAAAQ